MFHDNRGVGADGPDYFGPPRPGQSFAQYESFMSMPIAVGTGGALVGLLLGGPVVAVAAGIGSWITAEKMKTKSKTQGG